MALTPERLNRLAADAQIAYCLGKHTNYEMAFARAIEAEVRKHDTELIRQMLSALTDLVEAGEEAWGKDRPCVRIGKEEINAARARLGEGNGL